MLVDKIDKRTRDEYFGDGLAPVFYIDEDWQRFHEDVGDYRCGHGHNWGNLPQRLPYERFFINFKNTILFVEVRYADEKVYRVVVSHSCTKLKFNASGCFEKWVLFEYNVPAMSLDRHITGSIDDEGNPCDILAKIYTHFLQKFLTFLSCKNVATERSDPSPLLQKRREKKNKPPLASYYIMKLQSISSAKNQLGGGGWSNRVHFCRGHVREYTEDKPLFGKVSGKFWVAPHARGNKNMGEIKKDYRIDISQPKEQK